MDREIKDYTKNELAIDGLSAGYGSKVIVSGFDINVSAGQILSIIGPNGAGKSTILKTIIGQLKPLGGSIAYLGESLTDMGITKKSKLMSVQLTSKVDVALMSVRDVVSMGRYPYTSRLGRLSADDHKVIDRCMEDTHILELADEDFDTLSDGQKQRVMLARALCQEPSILVLDEPTSYLDIRYSLEFADIISTLASKKETIVIMSIHELGLAKKLSDMVLCIKKGKVDKVGKPEEVFADGYIEYLYDVPKEYSKWLE